MQICFANVQKLSALHGAMTGTWSFHILQEQLFHKKGELSQWNATARLISGQNVSIYYAVSPISSNCSSLIAISLILNF